MQSSPAGAAKRVVMMDGLLMLGFGPRAPDAARDLIGQFYPDSNGSGRGDTMTAVLQVPEGARESGRLASAPC